MLFMDDLKKNMIVETTVEGYSSEGHGVCRVNGRAVFVPRTLMGERWIVRIIKVGSSAVYGRGEQLIVPSSARCEADCPYFGKCGGCDLRHMRYDEELRFKLGRVNDALARIGKQTRSLADILGCDATTRYRNKGIFAIAEKDGLPCCGFYRERTHELIPVEHCLIQDELAERAADAVVRFMRLQEIPAYDETTGHGLVRHVFCRRAADTADAVVCIVSTGGFGSRTEAFVSFLRDACPEVTGIVLNVNKSRGNTVLEGRFHTLWGRPDIRDMLCGNTFTISPQAFFQVNPRQAEKLYQKTLELAAPTKDELVFDLYCGAGTISLCLARQAKYVIGAEVVPEAVENARENAKANGLCNVEFFCGDSGEAAKALAERNLHPDLVVVDPPRKGMAEAAVHAVASMLPARIVYVSCNPATLARDILRFQSLGYALTDGCAVDMFPRTSHVETVCLLYHQKKDFISLPYEPKDIAYWKQMKGNSFSQQMGIGADILNQEGQE